MARSEISANESGLQEQVIVQDTQVFETGEMRVMRKINSLVNLIRLVTIPNKVNKSFSYGITSEHGVTRDMVWDY